MNLTTRIRPVWWISRVPRVDMDQVMNHPLLLHRSEKIIVINLNMIGLMVVRGENAGNPSEWLVLPRYRAPPTEPLPWRKSPSARGISSKVCWVAFQHRRIEIIRNGDERNRRRCRGLAWRNPGGSDPN